MVLSQVIHIWFGSSVIYHLNYCYLIEKESLIWMQSNPGPTNDTKLLPFIGAINDIYPGSSTYPKVVFREVLHPIELEFGNVDF